MSKTSIKINLTHKAYLRDPESTELGRRIIKESIILIDELGFEQFTFRKLATVLGSTEASIYRYFENKHKLLVYLVSWHWAWLDYSVLFQTNNMPDPRLRLSRAIDVITTSGTDDPATAHVNESALYRIVIAEASKVYLTKEVDMDNKDGYFLEYKRLCHHIAEMVLDVNPNYPYPHALISTIMEAAHQQLFFAQHLPSLTEIKGTQRRPEEAAAFLKHLVFAAVDQNYKAA
ncbi:TetR/AcrR family transcriptional regulator [uncultured Pontibacter sp.]|uniref:TetR/AcrR family transcriptional regulator n=1 Tax=uncultured Pontibacter sp. TaxID=453356 RepID=UPI0026386087|nr:TetR/AcrR family transcriptional regulator [uncultured Pontibacter sp.]